MMMTRKSRGTGLSALRRRTRADLGHELDLGRDEVLVARHQGEPADLDRHEGRGEVAVTSMQSVHRVAQVALVHAGEPMGCVALRVAVDEQHLALCRRERGRKVHGGGGLADPALLVGMTRDDALSWGGTYPTGDRHNSTRCRSSDSPGTVSECTGRPSSRSASRRARPPENGLSSPAGDHHHHQSACHLDEVGDRTRPGDDGVEAYFGSVRLSRTARPRRWRASVSRTCSRKRHFLPWTRSARNAGAARRWRAECREPGAAADVGDALALQ